MKKMFFVSLFLVACLSQAQKTKNVIYITLDGLRWQELFSGADPKLVSNASYVKDTARLERTFWKDAPEERRKTLMPFFWGELVAKGQLHGNRSCGSQVNVANKQWFSYPGYNENLAGFADDERIRSNDKFYNPNETLLEWMNKKSGFKGKVAAFASWDVFPFIINDKRSGVPVHAGYASATGAPLTEKEKILNQLQKQLPWIWETVTYDAFTHQYALEYLKKYHPRFVYISFGETDDFAHEGRYDQYLDAAHRADAFIREIWSFAQSDPAYRDKTTLLITCDHGRGAQPLDQWKSHGASVEGSDQTWVAVIGPDTPALGEVCASEQLYNKQWAASLARFLGLEYTAGGKAGGVVKSFFK